MDLDKIRMSIDELDQNLVKLFIKRMKLTQEVAEYKAKRGLEVEDLLREKRIVSKLVESYPEYKRAISDLYQEIFKISKDYQRILIENGKNQ